MYDVKVEYLPHYNRAWGELRYAKPGDSGFDLRAAISESVYIEPGCVTVIPCGVRFALPKHSFKGVNIEMQVRSRSGLAAKHGILVLNSPGTVDNEYRGEVCAILLQAAGRKLGLGEPLREVIGPFRIDPGDRIAQAVIATSFTANLIPTAALDKTERGEAGFGSTGVAA